MDRPCAALLLVVLIVVFGVTPDASACTVEPVYDVDPELLAGDFNALHSALNVDFAQWVHELRVDPRGFDTPIEVYGAYTLETIHSADRPDWTAGSVSV